MCSFDAFCTLFLQQQFQTCSDLQEALRANIFQPKISLLSAEVQRIHIKSSRGYSLYVEVRARSKRRPRDKPHGAASRERPCLSPRKKPRCPPALTCCCAPLYPENSRGAMSTLPSGAERRSLRRLTRGRHPRAPPSPGSGASPQPAPGAASGLGGTCPALAGASTSGHRTSREPLPKRSSFTSLAAFSPSSRRFLSIILLLSTAALSSALSVQPILGKGLRYLAGRREAGERRGSTPGEALRREGE